ncbi:hypothetical protein HHK36_022500 [Tetracentron sinense]|uniref:Phosphate transporter PHO1 n=1 Tax=Tetracentron sinense TaxID=13715 RepID=A0A835D6D2_TETSI|nr:hypothetical protein HHK36_022500 [Tetracentron sinense]
MVKFSKELEAQLIPEWKDAFLNYWQLKKNVKKIKLSQKSAKTQEKHNYWFSIFNPIRWVSKKIFARSHNSGDKNEIIQVKNKNGVGNEDLYQTELIQLFSEEDEEMKKVKEFFEKLDEELNKVNQFYKTKESEFIERGEILNKQLQILLELKQVLNDRKNFQSRLDAEILPRSNSSLIQSSDYPERAMKFTQTTLETTHTDDVITEFERNGINFIGSATRSRTKKGKPKTAVRIDIPATTPTRTIITVTSMLWEDLVNNPKKEGPGDFIDREKIQCAEKMIRGAFVELYRGLGLLKMCSSLNMVAFTKILKKFDKVSNRQASGSYLKAVKKSHFFSSDKVVRLGDEVETIFTKYFANHERKRAMKFLRPQQKKESHLITFFVGLFTGCFVTLFSVYAILAHLSGMFSPTEADYMETGYPVFSMFALLSLHLFMHGCNLLMWKSTRINYNFIFEFSPSTALKYRDVFLICTSFMTTVVGAMVIHLLLRSNGFSPHQVDAIPRTLLLIFTCLLILPFNIFYRSSRYYFIRVIRNILCSPFYKVVMVDFFMADQLTSQIPLLRYMEYTICSFLARRFQTHQYETCKSGKLYRDLAYVISVSPYYLRAMQCARRWFEEGRDVNHLANLGKYVSAMVATGVRITYARKPMQIWQIMVIVTSSVATVYQLYWDFVKDWGLLNPKSKNMWLRDELILKNKCVYYLSIALNLVLRLAWVETVMHFNVNVIESRFLDFSLASLEIIRRGHWNFYRLENEHLNNVGKFRAVKTVPLPFRDMDSDD